MNKTNERVTVIDYDAIDRAQKDKRRERLARQQQGRKVEGVRVITNRKPVRAQADTEVVVIVEDGPRLSDAEMSVLIERLYSADLTNADVAGAIGSFIQRIIERQAQAVELKDMVIEGASTGLAIQVVTRAWRDYTVSKSDAESLIVDLGQPISA